MRPAVLPADQRPPHGGIYNNVFWFTPILRRFPPRPRPGTQDETDLLTLKSNSFCDRIWKISCIQKNETDIVFVQTTRVMFRSKTKYRFRTRLPGPYFPTGNVLSYMGKSVVVTWTQTLFTFSLEMSQWPNKQSDSHVNVGDGVSKKHEGGQEILNPKESLLLNGYLNYYKHCNQDNYMDYRISIRILIGILGSL